jgi:hypothetical protein
VAGHAVGRRIIPAPGAGGGSATVGVLCPCSGGPSAALWPPPSCWPGQRARNAALPSPPAARRRPNAQARTAILPPVEVRPVSRAIPTLSNLTSHIQRSVPGGRPTRAAAETGPRPLAQPRLTNLRQHNLRTANSPLTACARQRGAKASASLAITLPTVLWHVHRDQPKTPPHSRSPLDNLDS